jgi:membrane-associated phospholipid phosphatase
MPEKQSHSRPNLLRVLDERASEALYIAGSNVPRLVWKFLEHGGDGRLWLPIAVAALLAPGAKLASRQAWANLLLGLILDLVLVGLLKGLVRRPRPVHNSTHNDMHVVVAVDNYSFPSGHASR